MCGITTLKHMQWEFNCLWEALLLPEAIPHPEALPLDEGLYLFLLTLAQCPSIQQPALVTKQSEAVLLDVVYVH